MLPWQDGNPNILGNILWISRDKNLEYLLNCNWNNNFETPFAAVPLDSYRKRSESGFSGCAQNFGAYFKVH
jgi:hypothetical protein